MKTRWRSVISLSTGLFAAFATLHAGASIRRARADEPPVAPAPQPDPQIDDDTKPRPIDPALLDRIAKVLLDASPVALTGIDEVQAREHAADRLGKAHELIDSMEQVALWGAIGETGSGRPKGVERGAGIRETRLDAIVLVRVYLSLFTFTGEGRVSASGDLRLLEIPAQFRVGLGLEDYPEPMWMTPEAWRSYTRTTSLVLSFRGNTLLAVNRRLSENAADVPVPGGAKAVEAWTREGAWPRTDIKGKVHPRGATLAFLLAPENPDAEALGEVAVKLDGKLRAAGCFACHSATDHAVAPTSVILDTQIHALAARKSLKSVLFDPAGHGASERLATPCKSPGVADPKLLEELRALAEKYEELSETAFAYEEARRAFP